MVQTSIIVLLPVHLETEGGREAVQLATTSTSRSGVAKSAWGSMGARDTDNPIVAISRVDAFFWRGRGSQELQLGSLVWRDSDSAFEKLQILCCKEFDKGWRRRERRAQRRLARLHHAGRELGEAGREQNLRQV